MLANHTREGSSFGSMRNRIINQLEKLTLLYVVNVMNQVIRNNDVMRSLAILNGGFFKKEKTMKEDCKESNGDIYE